METGLRATARTQWRHPRQVARLAAASVAAVLLHAAIASLLLGAVHTAVAPNGNEAPALAMVFAPPAAQPAAVPEVAAPAGVDVPPPSAEPVLQRPAVTPSAEANPPDPTPAVPETAVPPGVASPPPAEQSPQPPVVTPKVKADLPQPQPQPEPAEQAVAPMRPPAVAADTVPPEPPATLRAPPRGRQPVARRASPADRPAPAKQAAAKPTATRQNTPAPPAAPAGSSAAEPAHAAAPIAGGWQRALAAWLAAHKSYPEAARQRGEEGVSVLRFTVERSGKVLDVALVRSAGSAILDAAAEAMVRNGNVPPFPAEMPQDRVTVTVQIRYALAD